MNKKHPFVPHCYAYAPASKRRGFSLVELLVVLAIMLVLIALLLPALGKARYQAKLTVCLSNLRQVGQGGMAFADDNNSNWPIRPFNGSNDFNNGCMETQGSMLKYVGFYDVRPKIKNYIDINRLNCPLSPYTPLPQNINGYNFDPTATTDLSGNPVSGNVTWSYGYWFGWWDSYGPGGAMNKVGQYFYFQKYSINTSFKCRVLAGDTVIDEATTFVSYSASHLDTNGAMSVPWYDDFKGNYSDPTDSNPSTVTTGLITRRQNYMGDYVPANTIAPVRGTVDLNFVFDDGSARTYMRVDNVFNPLANFTRTDILPTYITIRPDAFGAWATYLPPSN